jgi:hypothetical protein
MNSSESMNASHLRAGGTEVSTGRLAGWLAWNPANPCWIHHRAWMSQTAKRLRPGRAPCRWVGAAGSAAPAPPASAGPAAAASHLWLLAWRWMHCWYAQYCLVVICGGAWPAQSRAGAGRACEPAARGAAAAARTARRRAGLHAAAARGWRAASRGQGAGLAAHKLFVVALLAHKVLVVHKTGLQEVGNPAARMQQRPWAPCAPPGRRPLVCSRAASRAGRSSRACAAFRSEGRGAAAGVCSRCLRRAPGGQGARGVVVKHVHLRIA